MAKAQVKQYAWKITLLKGLRRALQFGLPLFVAYMVQFYPAIMSLTVGTILEMLINWIKNKNK